MKILEITTTIGCTVACVYCPQKKLTTEYKKKSGQLMMSSAHFKRYLERIPEATRIHFSGMCEPWLNPECTDMILHANQKGHEVKVSTMLAGMTVTDIERIQHIPFISFDVHLPSSGEGGEQIAVNNDYLDLIGKLQQSPIRARYRFLGESVHNKILLLLKDNLISNVPMNTRAGNRKIKNRKMPSRKNGRINCKRELRQNVLLPNGDVVLCCMDYSMKHVLGNLSHNDYQELFNSDEFEKVKSGLHDESIDILCRFCDQFAFNDNFFPRTYHTKVRKILKLFFN